MTIVRFHPKPVVLEAVQWTGGNEQELIAFTAGRFAAVDPEDRGDDPDGTGSLLSTLHNAWEDVREGTWIVKGVVDGEIYAVPDDVMTEMNEPLPDIIEGRYRIIGAGDLVCTECGCMVAEKYLSEHSNLHGQLEGLMEYTYHRD